MTWFQEMEPPGAPDGPETGDEVIDRENNLGPVANTSVVKTNPSAKPGTITQVEIWIDSEHGGDDDLHVGMFEDTGAGKFKCRSAVNLGIPGVGYKKFTGLSLAVAIGDYIGWYCYGMGIDATIPNGAGIIHMWNGNAVVVDQEETYNEFGSVTGVSILGKGYE